jgi:hypothetical protein
LPTLSLLSRLNDEDARVASAVRRALPSLAAVVDEADRRLAAGGRVHYFGSGTSGGRRAVQPSPSAGFRVSLSSAPRRTPSPDLVQFVL